MEVILDISSGRHTMARSYLVGRKGSAGCGEGAFEMQLELAARGLYTSEKSSS